jgi:hypothetical protein
MVTSLARRQSDALTTVAWGLRHYAWIVVLAMLGLGVALPVVLHQSATPTYEARAEVGPTEPITLDHLDAVPRIAETIFRNGAVSAAVRRSYDPPLPDATNVIPGKVDIVTDQENPIFVVLGRGRDPHEAQELADVAAGRFVDELNRYERVVTRFAVQRPAMLPAAPVSSIYGIGAVVAGLLAGLVLGVGLIFTLLVWRQPVLDAASAERVTGIPLTATLSLGKAGPVHGLAHSCRRLLATSPDAVVLTGPKATLIEQERIATQLRGLLEEPGTITEIHGRNRSAGPHPQRRGGRSRKVSVVVSDVTQGELTLPGRDTVTFLVITVGTPASRLRRLTEVLVDPATAGILLLWRPRRGLAAISRRRSRPRETASDAA